MSDATTLTIEMRGDLLRIGLNRPAKRNAFDPVLLAELGLTLARYEEDPALRCAVLFAHGPVFTAGLDLAQVAPKIAAGERLLPESAIDPWNLHGRPRTKPLVVAVHGRCLTLGIELLLAADVVVADETARFAQIEIQRGIFPFGGATIRFVQRAGWGNAMRWLLTGDEYDAAEALRIGLVQEVVPAGQALERATAIAETIAAQAPLGVRATLANARLALDEGPKAAVAALLPEIVRLFDTEDAREGVASFLERRSARFVGR